MPTRQTKYLLCLTALCLIVSCTHSRETSEQRPANPDSAAGKTGQAAYTVSKETEKAAKVLGKETAKAAKEIGHEVKKAAKDAKAGWNEAKHEQ